MAAPKTTPGGVRIEEDALGQVEVRVDDGARARAVRGIDAPGPTAA